MAQFDSSARFDAGIRFTEKTFTSQKKSMAKIIRNWTKMNADERLDFGDKVVVKVPTSGVVPATDPDYVAFKAAYEPLKENADEIKELEGKLKTARLARVRLTDEWLPTVEQLARKVDSASKGDPEAISKTGYTPSEESGSQAPQEMTKVVNFTVTAGDADGELDYQHDRVLGARVYEAQTTTNPGDPASWVNQGSGTTRSSGTLKNLASGSRQWVRIRAVGPLGPGPWSDPATKIVP